MSRYTKIHELPEKRYVDVSDTDILVIEDNEDTWHIPLGDLKMLFSNDAKINAMYQDLLDRIHRIEVENSSNNDNILEILENHTTQINALTESINNLNIRMTKIEHNITTIQSDINSLTERVETNENNITNINTVLDEHHDRISILEADNNKNKDDISNIQTDITNIRGDIVNINDAINQLNELIENYNGVSVDSIIKLKEELTEEIINKYEALLNLIDQCHHQIPIIE